MLAGTVNGVLDLRRGADGFGAAVIGNYGQSATPGNDAVATTENLQGKLRYDRYLAERASLFALVTGRHDRFQGLDFRLNLDPGFKYILVREQSHSIWLEAGYDFQYDVRRDDALGPFDATGKSIPQPPPPAPQLPLLDKTATDHSARLFAGYRHGFNKEVTLSTGLEYLQSFLDSTRYRINFDALLAAKVGGGFSVGIGFGLRYDHAPLPGKKETDTSTTLSLIYAFSDVPETPMCPCPPPAPPPETTAPPAPPPTPAASPDATSTPPPAASPTAPPP
jgi:putative salt-induced outer membrane protein YdiY